MFFATLSCKNTDTALPLLNILEILAVYGLHARQICTCMAQRYLARTLSPFSSMPATYIIQYNTKYAANQNLLKFRVKTNAGKQMISFMAIDLWQEIPNKFGFFKCFN